MSVTALPTAPNRSMDEETFIATSDPFLAALGPMVTQINSTIAGLNNLAAGGAMAIPYTFSTLTADSDPGAGFLRLNNASQPASTVIRVSVIGADGVNWNNSLLTFDDSTSAIKGYIKISKPLSPDQFVMFSVSSLASGSGYRNLTVVPVMSNLTSSFANGDSLILSFTRNGDAGIQPPGLTYLSTVTASNSATVDIETTIDSTYDNYIIIADDITVATASATLKAQFKMSGAYDTSANYSNHVVTSASGASTYVGIGVASATSFQISPALSNAATASANFSMELFHPAGTTLLKTFKSRGTAANTTVAAIMDASGQHSASSTVAVTGVRIFASSGNILTGTFRLYGIKNS